MNTAAIIAVSVLLSAGAATGITLALAPAASPPPAAPGISASEFQAAIARLEEQQQKLQLALQQAGADSGHVERTAVPTISEQDIQAALQRYLTAHGVPTDAGHVPTGKTVEVAATFAALQKLKNNNYWSNQDAYKRVFDAGKMDELVAMFEANAQANPDDPTAQMQLADAYLAYVQLDQSKGPTLGMKSDKVLDRVLELDDHHWQARFTKAVSYSFWPDFLGKKKDAMAQFDRLVQQQENMAISPEQAQTYLFYGNMLDQAGQGDKAKEIWAKGLARHPGNADLQHRLGQ